MFRRQAGTAGRGVVDMEVRVLGPVEVRHAGGVVRLGRRQQRLLVGILGLEANQLIPCDRLIDLLWGDRPPRQARAVVQSRMSELRAALKEALDSDPEVELATRGQGYVLVIPPDRVDAGRFRHLVARSRETGEDDAGRCLREALGLWRGPVLGGHFSGDAHTALCQGLESARLTALEELFDIELRAGNHAQVVDEAVESSAANPTRERMLSQAMLALHRTGRSAEALHAYARWRQWLAAELGVDPGSQVQRLYLALLNGEEPRVDDSLPALGRGDPGQGPVPPPVAVPAQLPLDAPGFTGRAGDLDRLDAILDEAGGHPTAVAIAAVSGTAGVGKTTLAVHWAHRVRGRFPDGQLYVNLRGYDPAGPATSPADAIRGFLDALAVPPERIPMSLQAQAGLYRSLLSGRRMLIVLDNARDANQVRPLLPGAPGCVAVVTSRDQLSGLVATEGAHPVVLDLLPPAEARELLVRRLDPQRVAAEPDALEHIAAACARLPLALAIVAARAITRPWVSLMALAAELTGSIDAFAGPDPATDVRALFSWSYDTLSPAAARLFRLLGLYAGPDVSLTAAASLAGLPVDAVRPLLAELTRAHLLTDQPGPTDQPGGDGPGRARRLVHRYRFHDLLRAYAGERARAHDSEAERRAAQHRWLDHFARTAHAAAGHLYAHRDPVSPPAAVPGVTGADLADCDAALAWFAAEYPALVAAVEEAVDLGLDRHAWHLVWSVETYVQRRMRWPEMARLQQTALAAARRLADRPAQAYVHRVLGRSYAWLNRFDEAQEHYGQALRLFEALRDQVAQARVHHGLTELCERQGDNGAALRHAEQALDLYRAAGDRAGQARALNAVGWSHTLLGAHEQALTTCQQALELFREIGDRDGEAATCGSLGQAHQSLGDHDAALASYRRAIELCRELGDRYHEAATLVHLGDTHRGAGHVDEAESAWLQALELLVELNHPDAEPLRQRLGSHVPARTRRPRR